MPQTDRAREKNWGVAWPCAGGGPAVSIHGNVARAAGGGRAVLLAKTRKNEEGPPCSPTPFPTAR